MFDRVVRTFLIKGKSICVYQNDEIYFNKPIRREKSYKSVTIFLFDILNIRSSITEWDEIVYLLITLTTTITVLLNRSEGNLFLSSILLFVIFINTIYHQRPHTVDRIRKTMESPRMSLY